MKKESFVTAVRKEPDLTREVIRLERDLVTALQLLLSSFALLHKPSRISVRTAKGWKTGVVDDGTEGAIEHATQVLKRAAQHLKSVDPDWKHALDELFPAARLHPKSKKNLQTLSAQEIELSALFELRWVAHWLDEMTNGNSTNSTLSLAAARDRIKDVLLRLEERS